METPRRGPRTRRTPRRRVVCVATIDGGLATPPSVLDALVGAGDEVTVLVPTVDGPAPSEPRGARLARVAASPLPVEGPAPARAAEAVFRFLEAQGSDLVLLPLEGGLGVFALAARRQGLAFAATRFVVAGGAPTLWRRERDGEPLRGVEDLEVDFMERTSVAAADALLGGAELEACASWMDAEGWSRPPLVDASFVRGLEERVVPRVASSGTGSARPLVTVALVHRDRPHLLRQALDSLLAQDYPRFEVVLVDDGSETAAARAALDALEPTLRARGWSLLRTPNRYLGAARNAAVRCGRGEYFLFMDDDNVATPSEIGTLVRAATASGADVVTSFFDAFAGEAPPADEGALFRRIFLGGPWLAGIFRNVFGDANALVARAALERVGGFTEDRGVAHEDWELFARIVGGGGRLEVVPRALFRYRLSPASMMRRTSAYRNHRRSLRPYVAALPHPLRALAPLAQDLGHRTMRADVERERARTAGAVDALLGAAGRLADAGEADTARRLVLEALEWTRAGRDERLLENVLDRAAGLLARLGEPSLADALRARARTFAADSLDGAS